MSKLLTEPRNGYVKPKDDASSGIYPKTLVDAVYNEEKGESLSETLKNLESKGSGGGSFVEINADWSKFGSSGFACSSKEEALSSLGISEELFDAILDGSYANAYMKNTFSGTEHAYDVTIINYFKPFRYVGSDVTFSNGAETVERVVKFMLWDVEVDKRLMPYHDCGSYGSYFQPTYKDGYPDTRAVGFGFFSQWHQWNKTTREDEVLENVYVIFGLYGAQE